ncbi:uncharacterized protein [Triticum aestivum]|uniref:uncharacterized protein isoform X4 n=1 Tax=Triticum aestivum TaxID=4565 RepID=UPI001D01B6BC|nr:uncharacterized protein LOC123189933 isoform X4 [Triticum aestivum]
MKLVEEEGKPSKELPVETLNIVKRKRKSSNVQNAESRTASELHGVVWPTHIMERPDSEFKEKLMRLLRKPFSQGECDTLLDKATTRPPATMKRQTRGGVKYYNSEHERQPSYFDGHPETICGCLCSQVVGPFPGPCASGSYMHQILRNKYV